MSLSRFNGYLKLFFFVVFLIAILILPLVYVQAETTDLNAEAQLASINAALETLRAMLDQLIFLFGRSAAQVKAQTADISTGLVGHWTFDEGIGTSAGDSSVSGNTGTLNGSTWSSFGKIGGALSFDGSNDYVDVPSVPFSFSSYSAITVSAWIRNDVGQGSGTDDIISYWNFPSSKSWVLTHHNNDQYFWEISGKGNISGGSVSTLWTHVVGTYDGSTMRLYMNGIEVVSKTGFSGTLPVSSANIRIGSQANGGNYFDGLIDDVRIYNRALTQEDITALYSFTGSPPAPDTTPPTRSNGTPTGILSSGTTQTTISLTTNESATCRYSTTLGTSYSAMTNTFSTTGGTTHSATVFALQNGQSYLYYVRCQDTAGNSNTSDYTISFSVANPAPFDTTPPSIPQNLTATAQSSSQINLSWSVSTDNVGVTGYRVERCTGSTCTNFTQVATPSSNQYQDTSLQSDTTYRYRVRAVDAAGNVSGYSSVVSGVTQVQQTGTYPPGDSFANNKFFNSTEPGCDPNNPNPNYLLCDDFEDGTWFNKIIPDRDGWDLPDYNPPDNAACGEVGANGTNCAADMGYRQFGGGQWGDHTLSSTADEVRVRFYAWKSPGYTFGNEKIFIMMDAGGGQHFRIRSSVFNSGQPGMTLGGLDWSQNQGNNFNWTNLTGRWILFEWHIKVSSGLIEMWIDDCGTDGKQCPQNQTLRMKYTGLVFGAGSNPVGAIKVEHWGNGDGVTTGSIGRTRFDQIIVSKGGQIGPMASGVPSSDTTPPTTPTNLSATAQSSNQINLSWGASTDDVGVTGYRVERNGTLLTTVSTNSHQDTSLTTGTTYTYTVSAVDSSGNESPQSGSVSATTLSDATAPTVSSVHSAGDPNKVFVTYSEPVELASATNISNYSIGGISVSGATLGSDLKTVTLTTSTHADNFTYTIIINNIRDRATVPNTILANTQTTYMYRDALLSETFNTYTANADPTNWYDSDANNSLNENTTLFKTFDESGNTAFGTASTLTNIHSHYNGAVAAYWSNYTYTGRMYMTDTGGGMGITFFSKYPNEVKYYRIRRYSGSPSFHLSPVGTSVTGTTNSGVNPQADTWYHFKIETENTGTQTTIKAKIWQDGTAEPTTYQIDATDTSATRLTGGTVGLWTMANGSKYFDDLQVVSIGPPPPPDTEAPTTPTNLSATAQSSNQINLSWGASTDDVGVTGYRVERCKGESCTNFTQVATPSGTTFNNTALTADTTYRYRVRSTDVAGNLSSYSTIISATTQSQTTNKFNLNDRIQVQTGDGSNLNVRSCASTSCTSLGTQTNGAQGTIIGGPATADGFTWWQVDFDSAPDGWSVEDWLTDASVATGTNECDSNNPNPDHLLCDDFEDGVMYRHSNIGGTTETNDGWSAPNYNPPDNAMCGGVGPAGSMCVADLGYRCSSGGQWTEHAIDGSPSEIWVRYYMLKNNNGAPYDHGHEKMLLFRTPAYNQKFIMVSSNYDNPQPVITQNIPGFENLGQNLGNNFNWTDLTDHWILFEFHLVDNSAPNVADGTFEMWIDDCGIDGASCPTTQTLRMSHVDNFSFGNGGAGWGYIQLEQWAHGVLGQGFSCGRTLFDDVVVSTRGHIGPLNATPYTPDTTSPSTPTNLSATAQSSNQINLSWSASTDNVAISNYQLERCTGSSCATFTQISTPSGITHSDIGLTANITYHYRVRATDAAGNVSGYSGIVNATTQAQAIINKFQTGDRVQTTNNLNVRNEPTTNNSLLGTQSTGSLGTIIGGPATADGFTWWQVDYDTAPDGWSVGDWLVDEMVSQTTACTDGVDCYCDRVNNPADPLYDPNSVLCEDFEAVTLHDNVNFGGSAPLYGPWYDETGFSQPGARGYNSYWRRNYGPSVGSCAWHQPNPVAPILGESCAFSTCFQSEWRADDLWQGNDQACIDIVRGGEFDDEISTLQDPIVPGGTSGVFDGNQILSSRIAPGHVAGIYGRANFGQSLTTLGVTMATAYPTNSQSADLWAYPWKHNEWITAADGGRGDGAFLFHNTNGLLSNDPFQQFMFIAKDKSQADCDTALANANVRRGSVSCNDVALYYRADSSYYDRARDWPFGTWGCSQGYFENLGTSNASIKIWFDGTLIIDIDGLDGSFLSSKSGYTALAWNNYSNRNQTANLSTQTTYRYEDNVHITAGPPVSCQAIGFPASGTTDTTAPSTPTNITATAQSSSQIDLSWSASTDNVGVTGYRVERCQGVGCLSFSQVSTVSGQLSYSDTGLSSNTTYRYRVMATDAAGNLSGYSSVVSAVTLPLSDTTAPTISSITTSSITTDSSFIFWTTNELSTSQVDYGTDTTYGMSTPLSSSLSASHSATLSNLSSGTLYHYRVRSKDSVGNESISTDQTFMTLIAPDITPPADITDLTPSNITETSVDLITWSAPGDDGNIGTAASYDLRYDTALITISNFSQLAPVTGLPIPRVAGTPQSYTLVGLQSATTYYAVMKTSDEVPNFSGFSNIISFTTLIPPDTTSPTIFITSPSSNTTVSHTTTVSADVSDDRGITSTVFLIDNIIVNTDTTAPYLFSWDTTTVSDGSHIIKARATDTSGNTTLASSVTVIVDNAPIVIPDAQSPTIYILTPLTDTIISETAIITAEASDDTEISSVDFYIDDSLVGAQNTAPYTINWDTTTVTDGAHSLKATAHDTAGNQTTSAEIAVTVSNPVIILGSEPTSRPSPNSVPTPASSGGGGGGSYAPSDTTPPPSVADPISTGADNQITLSWINPVSSDYVRTVIVRKEGSQPISPSDGTVIYQGTAEEYTDIDLDNTKTYYYAIYTHDRVPNYSVAQHITAQPTRDVTTIIVATTPSTSTQSLPFFVSFRFTEPLFFTKRHLQVERLQQFLNYLNIMVATQDAGSPGQETDYYGGLTTEAVQRFQAQQGIVSGGTSQTTGYGRIGPKTRTKLNQLIVQYAGGGSIQVPTVTLSTLSSFIRNLTIGLEGDDVKQLQIFLNNQGFTIAYEGVGSPGEETTYFGTRTVAALIRFQEAFASEILTPVNLTRGTGFFGPSTRRKANALNYQQGTVPQQAVPLLTPSSTKEQGVNVIQQQMELLQGNPPPAPLTTDPITYFADRLKQEGVRVVGQPTEGFNAFLLLDAFPGLTEADFHEVPALGGIYRYTSGALFFVRSNSQFIIAIGQTISIEGYALLLGRVSERLGITAANIAGVERVIEELQYPLL